VAKIRSPGIKTKDPARLASSMRRSSTFKVIHTSSRVPSICTAAYFNSPSCAIRARRRRAASTFRLPRGGRSMIYAETEKRLERFNERCRPAGERPYARIAPWIPTATFYDVSVHGFSDIAYQGRARRRRARRRREKVGAPIAAPIW